MNKKKSFIALFLALATMASVAVTAVADVSNINNENVAVLAAVNGIDSVSFGKDTKTGVSIDETLTPGNTYLFPVMVTSESGSTSQMTKKDMDNYTVEIKEKNGKENLSSIELVKKNDNYSLEVVTKSQWTTQKSEVEYLFKVIDKETDKVVSKNTLEFEVGYNPIKDATLFEQAKDGGYIVISNDAPVITKEQFEDIDDLTKGEKVTLSSDNWQFEVKITSQGAVNMLSNRSAIKDVVQKYEDSEMEFMGFPGAPKFKFSGTVTISVADLMENFESFYVYKYENGNMVNMNAVLDKQEETLSFDTKTLGSFVIIDKEITNDTEVQGGDNSGTEGTTDNNAKTNPSTGSASVMGATVAMAVAAAGAFLSKKAK